MSRILLFIFCVLEVNRMIRGHPNHQQTIGRAVTSQSRDESGLVRDIPSLDDENKDTGADVADRDTDKSGDTENKHWSRQSIENSSQSALDPIIQLQNNVNNNNNNTEDAQNKSQDYSNELISFFNKENFKNWNRRDNDSEAVNIKKGFFREELISSIFNKTKDKNNKFKPVIPPECHGETICEHAPDYPEDIFRGEWDDSFLRQFATKGQPSLTLRTSFSDYVGDKRSNLCKSSKHPVIPKIGMTVEGEYKYIIQSQNLKQWYESEICMEEHKSCTDFLSFLPLGYSSACVQQYIDRQLASISYDGREEANWFRVKSNCCCHMSYNLRQI